MTPPSLSARIIGSVFVGPMILAITGYIIFLCLRAGAEGVFGYLTIALFIAVVNTMKEVAAYRKWEAEWESMALGEREQRRRKRNAMIGTALVAVAAFAIFAVLSSSQTNGHCREWGQIALVAVGVFFAVWMLRRFLGWLFRRHNSDRSALVVVAVRKRLVPVVGLSTAYQRLPDYCRTLLNPRS